MQSNKKSIYTETIIDNQGEVNQRKWITKQVSTTEEFVLMYIRHIALIAQLPHFQLQTLLCLAAVIEWSTGEFTLDSKTMSKIVECSGLNERSIRNAVTKMKDKNIVQRIKTNWYKLNPELFWKGTELERQKCFDVTYRWEIIDHQ